MQTTTATPPRRAVESALLHVLLENRLRQASHPGPRHSLFNRLLDRLPSLRLPTRLAEPLRRARAIGSDVLENEALAIAGMAVMFLAFLLV